MWCLAYSTPWHAGSGVWGLPAPRRSGKTRCWARTAAALAWSRCAAAEAQHLSTLPTPMLCLTYSMPWHAGEGDLVLASARQRLTTPPPPPPKGEAAARSPEGAACGKAAWQSRPAPAPPANAQLMPPTRTPSQQPGASCHQHEHPGRAELWMLHASMAALHPRWAALPWR